MILFHAHFFPNSGDFYTFNVPEEISRAISILKFTNHVAHLLTFTRLVLQIFALVIRLVSFKPFATWSHGKECDNSSDASMSFISSFVRFFLSYTAIYNEFCFLRSIKLMVINIQNQ